MFLLFLKLNQLFVELFNFILQSLHFSFFESELTLLFMFDGLYFVAFVGNFGLS